MIERIVEEVEARKSTVKALPPARSPHRVSWAGLEGGGGCTCQFRFRGQFPGHCRWVLFSVPFEVQFLVSGHIAMCTKGTFGPRYGRKPRDEALRGKSAVGHAVHISGPPWSIGALDLTGPGMVLGMSNNSVSLPVRKVGRLELRNWGNDE